MGNGHNTQQGSWLTGFTDTIRSMTGMRRLPPGDQIELDSAERSDRKILLALAAQHGPIFKLIEQKNNEICVIGLPLARKLLKAHAGALRPVTIELTSLFSAGFMRQMVGETHKKYRASLVAAINELDIKPFLQTLQVIASRRLERFYTDTGNGEDTAHDYLDALTDIATGFLLRIFFGA